MKKKTPTKRNPKELKDSKTWQKKTHTAMNMRATENVEKERRSILR